MSISDHPSALDLADAQEESTSAASVREHLLVCVACRVREARLRRFEHPDEPSNDAITRILEASTQASDLLGRLTTVRDEGAPRPGEIWRVGRDEALLVWIRRTLGDSVDVIPTVLDVELADQESVLLPATATPLGVPLALLTGVRAHIGPWSFLQRVGFFDAAMWVEETISAAREGREPVGVEVGSPIESELDQRIEYRHVIADVLADLAPSRGDDTTSEASSGDDALGEAFLEALAIQLPERHFGAAVTRVESRDFSLSEGAWLRTCARVTYLDTSVVVALLAGVLATELSHAEALATACLDVVRWEPDADAIAIADSSHDWTTVVLPVPILRTAYEPPGGPPVGPRITTEPLAAVDALAKFLDGLDSAWEVTDRAKSSVRDVDLARLAATTATEAVAEIVREGQRARTPAKQLAWTTLAEDLSERIAESMMAITADEPTHAVLDRLTGGERA